MIRSSQESTVSSFKKYSGETRANVIAVVSADLCAYEDSVMGSEGAQFCLHFSKDISAENPKFGKLLRLVLTLQTTISG